MAQLLTLTDADVTNETGSMFVGMPAGVDRNRKLLISALFERLRTKTDTLQNKTLDATCSVQTAALAERYLISRNLLDNHLGAMSQRFGAGASLGPADNAYAHDRWYAQTESNPLTASTQTNTADGLPTMIRLTQSNVAAQRIGYAQALETAAVRGARGKPVTLSGKVLLSVAGTVRYAILGWTGTADAVTRDLVNTWSSASFTLGAFFATTNLALLGVGSVVCPVGVLTSLTPLTATVGSTANNLFVIAWTDGQLAQAATFDLALQLELGSAATPLEVPNPAVERMRAYRFYQQWGTDDVLAPVAAGQCVSTTVAKCVLPLSCDMRVAPAVTFSTMAVTTAANISTAVTGLVIDRATKRAVTLSATIGAASLVAGNATVLQANNSTAGFLALSADL